LNKPTTHFACVLKEGVEKLLGIQKFGRVNKENN
jgi:hypothetical protein